MKIATQAVHIGMDWDTRTGAVTIPVYQTATFRHPGLGQSTGYDYSRSGNPTRQALEEGMALLDGGARGFAYSSGWRPSRACCSSSRATTSSSPDLYGGTFRLFEQVFRNSTGWFSYADTSDTDPRPGGDPAHHAGAVRESLTNRC
jgi:cystathionine gamma-synthase/cystathionine beta-lyase